jgi:hypothetical protein
MSAAAPDGEAGGLSGGSAPLSIPQCRSESAGRPCVCVCVEGEGRCVRQGGEMIREGRDGRGKIDEVLSIC